MRHGFVTIRIRGAGTQGYCYTVAVLHDYVGSEQALRDDVGVVGATSTVPITIGEMDPDGDNNTNV